MADSKDDVILRLIIKGADPAEIAQAAQMTGGQLNAAMQVHIERLTELHRQASTAQTAAVVKAVEQQIKAEQQKAATIKALIDAEAASQAKVVQAAQKAADQQMRLAQQVEREATRAATQRAAQEDKVAAASEKAAQRAAAAQEREQQRTYAAANRAAEQWERANQRQIVAAERAATRGAAEAERVAAAQERAARVAGNASERAFRSMVEHMENITIVAQGVIGAVTNIASKVHEFGDEVIKVNQVLRSQGGGPSAFAISNIVGDITAYDITIARNKALQAELDITDKDFLKLAQAASELGDQMGQSSGEALQGFIDSINTGRTRMLASIGVVINAEEVYKRLAIQLTDGNVQALTEHDKKLALQNEIISELSKRAGGLQNVVDLSDQIEKSFTSATNAWHRFLQEIGSAKVPASVSGLFQSNVSAQASQLQQDLEQRLAGGGSGKYGGPERIRQLLEERKRLSDIEFIAAATDDKALKKQLELLDGLRLERSAKLREQLGIESEASLEQEREAMEAAGTQLDFFKNRFGPAGATEAYSKALAELNRKTAEEGKQFAAKLIAAKEAVQKVFDDIAGITKEQREIDPIEAVLFVDKDAKQKLVKDYLAHGEVAIRNFYRQIEASRQEFEAHGGLLPDPKKTIDELTANLESVLRDSFVRADQDVDVSIIGLGSAIEQRLLALHDAEIGKQAEKFADDYQKTLEKVLSARNEALNELEDTEAKTGLRVGISDENTAEEIKAMAEGLKQKFKALEKLDKIELPIGLHLQVSEDATADDVTAISQKAQEALRGLKDQSGVLAPLTIPLTVELVGADATVEQFRSMADQIGDTAQGMQSMIVGAAHQMTAALGQSIAASIASSNAHHKSIRQTTHDILESLAAQAFARAIFETAEGIADLAVYIASYGAKAPLLASAEAHFGSAAVFGLLGGGAALGARAAGNDQNQGAAGGTTSGTGGMHKTGSDFGSGSRSSNDNGGGAAPPTINLQVFPGGEAEAGRAVVKALKAYESETGRKVVNS